MSLSGNASLTLGILPDAWQEAKTHIPVNLNFGLVQLLIGLPLIPVLIVLVNVLWQFVFKSSSSPPVVFHWFPIIGSTIEYGMDPVNFFLRCREKYGNVFTFILLGRKMTVTLGPKGNNFVLGGKLSQVSAEEAYTHLTTPVFGKDVVFDVPNDVFMQQKKFIKVGLSLENFRAYVGMIVDEVENFLAHDSTFQDRKQKGTKTWEDGSFSVLRTMAQITILTASRTLQGSEVRSRLDKTFADLYHDLDGGFTPLNFLFPSLPLESFRKRDRAQKAMSDFYVEILKGKMDGKSTGEHDIMNALMHQRYKDGKEMTERQIAHLMIAMLMAGQHTSSAALSWLFLHLADRKEIADALYREQVEHFGTGEEGKFRDLTYEELKALPLLDAVIRETLRLHPPIHSIMRKVVSDMPVAPTLSAPKSKKRTSDAYVVPKGHFLLSSPAVSQVDPLIWKNPLRWDPYRWSDPQGVAAQALKTYTDESGEKVDYGFGAVSKGTESPYQPFGAGRHRCIGEQFAYLQIGTIISTLVRNVEMRLDGAMPEQNYTTMITVPKEPCDIKYRRRRVV